MSTVDNLTDGPVGAPDSAARTGTARGRLRSGSGQAGGRTGRGGLAADRWEVGSAFPLGLPTGGGWAGPAEEFRLYGSGRQALVALLEVGRREHGWTAVHLPEYYCPEVADDVAAVLPVHRYDAGPAGVGNPPRVGVDEVLVLVSYFGTPPVRPPTPTPAAGPTVVVDATHDPLAPWLPHLGADYAFASLRKTLPLPDGGMLWSTVGAPLPPPPAPSDGQRLAAGTILSAMCLKTAYLGGAGLAKEPYLAGYADGERRLRSAGVSAVSDLSAQLLHALPVDELRVRRITNAAVLADRLATLPGLTARAYPFGVVLECDSHRRREELRRALIARAVYPAVLWTLRPGESGTRHLDYSARMLMLHTDARWTERDMARVGTLVRQVVRQEAPPARTTTAPPARTTTALLATPPATPIGTAAPVAGTVAVPPLPRPTSGRLRHRSDGNNLPPKGAPC
ncbi:hypothetical protein [Plantactinospora sp. B5E13]|uniref:hypothetical protein n=1 Tax=Plantactinospora sp. B5E13 TaxID=3153758 RepID=UPI00325E6CB2